MVFSRTVRYSNIIPYRGCRVVVVIRRGAEKNTFPRTSLNSTVRYDESVSVCQLDATSMVGERKVPFRALFSDLLVRHDVRIVVFKLFRGPRKVTILYCSIGLLCSLRLDGYST